MKWMPTVKLADSHNNIHTIHLPLCIKAKILEGQFLTFSICITKQWNEFNVGGYWFLAYRLSVCLCMQRAFSGLKGGRGFIARGIQAVGEFMC